MKLKKMKLSFTLPEPGHTVTFGGKRLVIREKSCYNASINLFYEFEGTEGKLHQVQSAFF